MDALKQVGMSKSSAKLKARGRTSIGASASQTYICICTYIHIHTQVEFPAGRTVFRKGDPGDEFYLVRSGTALVLDNNSQVRCSSCVQLV